MWVYQRFEIILVLENVIKNFEKKFGTWANWIKFLNPSDIKNVIHFWALNKIKSWKLHLTQCDS